MDTFILLGNPIPYPCPYGYYCPMGVGPEPCPILTFMNYRGASNITDCIPCEAGYWCKFEGEFTNNIVRVSDK